MLAIPRQDTRRFLHVLRKAGLLKPVRQNLPPFVRLIADGQQLTLQAQDAELAVSWTIPWAYPADTLIVPTVLLTDASQRTEGEVAIRLQDGRLRAHWLDRGMPVEQEGDPLAADQLPPFPALPTEWACNPSTIYAALRQAMATTDPDSQRYALGCVQLNGSAGQITATDSRQALIQRGFQFPWSESLLIPARKLFTAEIFTTDTPAEIGRTGSHVALRCGTWTVIWTLETERRFPEVERILPPASAVRTRLQVDPADRDFAAERLSQLPQPDDNQRAVTLDLNGSVAVRARRSAESTPTELILRRSQRVGDEVRLCTDRRYLQRALELGFAEVGITSAEGPIICRDETRQYVWMTLAANGTVPPGDNPHQVDSLETSPTRPRGVQQSASADIAQTVASPPQSADRNSASRSPHQISSTGKATMTIPTESEPDAADPVTQLLALRQQVRTIEQSLVTVARQLRARRKQQQLMQSTLASLRQLQTLEV